MDKYLANYDFRLNLEIEIEFCPYDVGVYLATLNKNGVYMHPQVLTLGLRLPMTRFVHSVLNFL